MFPMKIPDRPPQHFYAWCGEYGELQPYLPDGSVRLESSGAMGRKKRGAPTCMRQKKKGTVEAAGFYAMVPDTEYALYGAVVPGDMEPGERSFPDWAGGAYAPAGVRPAWEAGFYTIPF